MAHGRPGLLYNVADVLPLLLDGFSEAGQDSFDGSHRGSVARQAQAILGIQLLGQLYDVVVPSRARGACKRTTGVAL